MHIELEQSLQQISSNSTRKYLPEEKDWVLNKMVERFVQSKLRPRTGGDFTYDQLDLDAIRPLIKEVSQPAYIDPDYANRYQTYLPADYAYLLNDSSFTSMLCGRKKEEQKVVLHLTYLKQIFSTLTKAPYYKSLSLTVDGTNKINIPGNLTQQATWEGYTTKQDVTFLIPWLVSRLNRLDRNIQSGYESYGPYYKPQHYVFAGDHAIPATLIQDGVDATVVTKQQVLLSQHKPYDNGKLFSNRLESSEIVQNLINTAFYKPSNRSPISELSGNTLFTYSDGSFIVNQTYFRYIRKHRPISLALGSDCELAPEYHQTICDLATEYIKGRIENGQGQQIVERDNEQRVKL